MVEFLYGDDLSKRIREVARGREARCAVAFWGRGSVFEVFGPDFSNRKDIQIICDISMGGTNPSTLRELGAPDNDSIRFHDGLHAKVYISDAGMIVGSANASSNGIGTRNQTARLTEAGAFFPSRGDQWNAALEWFEEIWKKKSASVDEEAISRAEELWNKRERMPSAFHIDPKLPNFLDYDSRRDGLIYPLWYCQNAEVANAIQNLDQLWEQIEGESWTTMADRDFEITPSWVVNFPVIQNGSRMTRRGRPFFFFADRREYHHIEEDYPIVIFKSRNQPTPLPPFNVDDPNLPEAFRNVIDREDYNGLRDCQDDAPWRVGDHVDTMHQFWRDVQDEYRRLQE